MIKIGLCLSGGGARGAAHVGVIRALQENNIEIHAVSGTSAGALVGAVYCAGNSVEKMTQFLKEGSIYKTIKFGIPDRGLGDLKFLKKVLPKYIKKDSFEGLEKTLFVTTTNLNRGKKQVFQSGELINPVIASSAVPVAFSPVTIDGEVHADGGTMDNFPVDPLLETCDLLIGINLLPQLEVGPKSLNSFMGVLGRVFDLSILANTAPNISRCDIVISPIKLHKYRIFDFGKVDELIEIGYESAMHSMDIIKTHIENTTSKN